MIDLHLHTTASDGRCSPEDLLHRLRSVGIHTFSVTDHDTVAALPHTASLARTAGLAFVPGLEITSVSRRKDVHILGYFIDWASPLLESFLKASRADRDRRARLMAERLAAMGAPIEIEAVMAKSGTSGSGKAIARPAIAQALVEAGHVRDVSEAFERFLADDRPAYVPREGASPEEVVQLIGKAGGVASLAHPGPLNRDDLIPKLVDIGLSAIEAFHSEHDPATVERYLSVARQYGLAVSGGSDYHGEGTRRSECLGITSLPQAHFDRLAERAQRGC